MRERFSFKKGYRGRTIFLICDVLFLVLLMVVMLIPFLKVLVDSLDPHTYGLRLFPKEVDLTAYKYILSKKSIYQPLWVSVYTTIIATVMGL